MINIKLRKFEAPVSNKEYTIRMNIPHKEWRSVSGQTWEEAIAEAKRKEGQLAIKLSFNKEDG